jgi:hypothetical protein
VTDCNPASRVATLFEPQAYEADTTRITSRDQFDASQVCVGP